MNSYEAKQEARRERLAAAADRAQAAADAAFKRADLREEVSGIPFGQPILVGHHSEGRHRAAIRRADAAMRKSIEESKRAADLRGKADAVGSGGISSDDPDAIAKLGKDLAEREAAQDFMREANKIVRAFWKAGLRDESGGDMWPRYLEKIQALRPGFPAKAAAQLLQPDFCGRIGFADFQLSNNSAQISRIKARIAQLERAAAVEPSRKSYQGLCEIVENVEENRLQIIFEGKPDAGIREELKSRGFRWAPSAGAWQRQLNNGARYAAKGFLQSQGIEA